jgi:hypothetical protein
VAMTPSPYRKLVANHKLPIANPTLV